AGGRFGHGDREQSFAADRRAQIRFALGIAAVVLQVRHADLALQRGLQRVRAHVGEPLDHDRRVQEVAASAAHGCGHTHAQKAGLADAAPALAIADAGLVPAGNLGLDVLAHVALELFPEQLVLGAKHVALHARESNSLITAAAARAAPKTPRLSASGL